MSNFANKLALKGLAEEDIYFAKRDRELINALHKKKLDKVVECERDDKKEIARQYEKRFKKITGKHKKQPKKLARACRNLVDEILNRCSRKSKQT